MLHFSRSEYGERLERLKQRLAAENLDAILLFAQESMYWLTGYDTFGFAFFQCLAVRADGEMVLVTRSADLRQAQHTSTIDNIVIWADSAHANPTHDLRDALTDLGLLGKSIGVEFDTQGLTAHNGRRLEATLATFGTLLDATAIVTHLRSVKSPAEIDHVRKAAAMADDAWDAALSVSRAGVSEAKILAAMQGAIFEAGGDYAGNEFIIGSGDDALLCRYKSGRRILDQNDQLTLEWAGASAHYHAAMMRTLIIGKPRREHEAHFEASKAAMDAVAEAMVVGNTFGDVFEAHAAELDRRGASKHRLNACGYSLGASFAPCWMDMPQFYPLNPAPIEPNMVLFAHMIIMDSESKTAMCLGQTYLTGGGKPECLSRHPLELSAV